MIYLKKFNEHSSYESKLNGGVGVDISLPNVSYCEDVKDVHYTPYKLVRFYVGEITGTTPQTVKIYTDNGVFNEVQVSDGNKWYTYALPKGKRLFKISGNTVTKVIVKADISFEVGETIIPRSTVEASFKGSNTSNVTSMSRMFEDCSGLTSLDLSNFDTSNVTYMDSMFWGCNKLTSLDVSSFNTSKVTNMSYMFKGCSNLTSLDLRNFNTSNVTDMSGMFDACTNLKKIIMKGCNQTTIDKIAAVKPSGATIIP